MSPVVRKNIVATSGKIVAEQAVEITKMDEKSDRDNVKYRRTDIGSKKSAEPLDWKISPLMFISELDGYYFSIHSLWNFQT